MDMDILGNNAFNFILWLSFISAFSAFARHFRSKRKSAQLTDLSGKIYLIAEIIVTLAALLILILFIALPSYYYYQG